ncbi:MAG TPA: nuclear transport factor 2 family protein [Myxococcota bacterium]|nr:nuclear transport factor 2 family protein [Myxococcota bacterium]HOC98878.1 nuclear transport factor 2 family protein [Myxococcota bacterium]HOH76152.1 nuclear transport factor 2 family protein [Myxococcota bacterium]HPV03614.1 nuclear transport factor 2 family protein [Myxococcota bacterium]
MRTARLFMIIAALPLVACAARQIPGTAVDDTPANRDIVEVIEKYRKACEKKDIDGILEVVSRNYFSNFGTTSNTDDDYGYEQLVKNMLPILRDEIKAVSYMVYVKKISFPRENVAWADVEHSYKFYYVEQGKDRWKPGTNFKRFEFAKEDGVWRITSGL